MDVDFLVVGGGIGGTVLAELLGRGGKKVLVLEKSTSPPHGVRPEILWPVTVQVLFRLIPRETLEKDALLPLRGVELKQRQQTVVSVSPKLLQEAQVQPWSSHPNQIREHLLSLGAFELRRGVEVVAVLKEQNRIVGVRTRDVASAEEREVLAHCTVGDDGVDSKVRNACDILMKTRLFPLDFLCFGFEWPPSLMAATGRVWLNFDRAGAGIFGLLAVPLPNGKGAGLVLTHPRVFEATAGVEEAWGRFYAMDAAIKDVIRDRKFPRDFLRIRRPWGHARPYGREGAILIGDAAHPVTPAGGQGANMSVADACALAEIALRREPNLLKEYERRRRAANERSMSFTRAAALFWGLPEWCLPASIFVLVLKWVDRHPWLLRRFIQYVSTAFQEKSR